MYIFGSAYEEIAQVKNHAFRIGGSLESDDSASGKLSVTQPAQQQFSAGSARSWLRIPPVFSFISA